VISSILMLVIESTGTCQRRRGRCGGRDAESGEVSIE